MNTENYLDHTFVVTSYDMDIWGYMRPTAILNICQEVAYIHSAQKDLGFDTLLSHNMAWVLSRVKVAIERLPVWREQVRVRTWHKRQSGVFSLRDYIFYDADDKAIIRVTTSWLIINLESRRIIRADKIFNNEGALTLAEYPHDAITEEAERIEIPTERCSAGDHKVYYSDMDVNHHVNNTRYLEWACDHSPKQMQPDVTLKGLCINFNHEAKFEDVVSLSTAPISPETTLIEGSIAQKNIFAVTMEYTIKQ
ncbi:MAG: acyl-ACP thioesterase domain-containing protein [Rikenellaceae bacterium]